MVAANIENYNNWKKTSSSRFKIVDFWLFSESQVAKMDLIFRFKNFLSFDHHWKVQLDFDQKQSFQFVGTGERWNCYSRNLHFNGNLA